jgi:hypothetical protein
VTVAARMQIERLPWKRAGAKNGDLSTSHWWASGAIGPPQLRCWCFTRQCLPTGWLDGIGPRCVQASWRSSVWCGGCRAVSASLPVYATLILPGADVEQQPVSRVVDVCATHPARC